jgi:hypothetical protein
MNRVLVLFVIVVAVAVAHDKQDAMNRVPTTVVIDWVLVSRREWDEDAMNRVPMTVGVVELVSRDHWL